MKSFLNKLLFFLFKSDEKLRRRMYRRSISWRLRLLNSCKPKDNEIDPRYLNCIVTFSIFSRDTSPTSGFNWEFMISCTKFNQVFSKFDWGNLQIVFKSEVFLK